MSYEPPKYCKWRIAFESLTPGGSEFVDDLPRCEAYVRERFTERHKAKGDVVKMNRAHEAERKATSEQLQSLLETLELGDVETACIWLRAAIKRLSA